MVLLAARPLLLCEMLTVGYGPLLGSGTCQRYRDTVIFQKFIPRKDTEFPAKTGSGRGQDTGALWGPSAVRGPCGPSHLPSGCGAALDSLSLHQAVQGGCLLLAQLAQLLLHLNGLPLRGLHTERQRLWADSLCRAPPPSPPRAPIPSAPPPLGPLPPDTRPRLTPLCAAPPCAPDPRPRGPPARP